MANATSNKLNLELISRGLNEFRDFLSRYRYPVLLNLIMCVCSAVIVGQFSLTVDIFATESIVKNDFAVYYQFSRYFFQGRLPEIYDDALILEAGTYQFRYLPSFLLVMAPFAAMNSLVVSYYFFTLVSFVFNLVSVFFIEKIATRISPGIKFRRYVWLFLILFAHLNNYPAGQPNSFVLVCVVLSLHYYLQGKDAIASICLGLSIIMKPVAYAVILFMVITSKKRAIKRAFFALAPLAFDALVFLLFPHLISGFISRNLGEEPQNMGSQSFINSIIFTFGGDAKILFVVLFAIFAMVGYWKISKTASAENKTILSFSLGILMAFLIQPQLWTFSLVFLYPILILMAALIEKRKLGIYWRLCVLYNCIVNYPILLYIVPLHGWVFAVVYVLMVITAIMPVLFEIFFLMYIPNVEGGVKPIAPAQPLVTS
jgi:hypothetical protein